jgi:hypothetical protein
MHRGIDPRRPSHGKTIGLQRGGTGAVEKVSDETELEAISFCNSVGLRVV